MSRIYDLETELSKLEGELANLKSYKTSEDNVLKNGDVYSHNMSYRVGSNAEIAAIEARIEKIKSELVEAREWEANASVREAQNESYKNSKENQAAADIEKFGKVVTDRDERYNLKEAQKEQEKKEAAIKDIQKKYKKGSTFQRFVATINGMRPNEKELMNLTSAELEYLVKLSEGETKEQEKSNAEISEDMRNAGVSYSRIKKNIKNANWQTFMHYINNPSLVEDSVRLEERNSRRR